ncbi:MAG: methyltransferase [Pseudoxanthomonas sp.]
MADAGASGTAPRTQAVDDRLLWDGVLACYRMPALAVADELGLFPSLAGQPESAAALAETLAISPRGCAALVGVLLAMHLLEHEADGVTLRPTDSARRFLLPGQPAYWGPALRLMRHSPLDYPHVLQAVRHADGPDWPRLQQDLWARHQADPSMAVEFADVMDAQGFAPAQALAALPAFAGVRRLLDVGGGSGAFSLALARDWPRLQATILDLAPTCRHAERRIADAGLQDRIVTTVADMWADPWPGGHDAILMSNIVHDWSEARNRRLFERAHAALAPGGRLFLHEMLLDEDGAGPATVAAYSMDMLLYTDGKQYRRSELARMLDDNGFSNIEVMPCCGYFSLIASERHADT